MNFDELIQSSGGKQSLAQVAKSLRLSIEEVSLLVRAVSPTFVSAVRDRVLAPGGQDVLRRLIESGGPQQYILKPMLMEADVSRVEGEAYLWDFVAIDGDLADTMKSLHEATDIRLATIEQALPRLACLFVGALCVKMARVSAARKIQVDVL